MDTSLVKKKKSRTRHLIKRIKNHHYKKKLMRSDMTLINRNGSTIILNDDLPESFIKKVEDRLNPKSLIEKLNDDMLDTNQKYEQIVQINQTVQKTLNDLIAHQNSSFEDIKRLDDQQIFQEEKLKLQNKIINEQQFIIEELLSRNKDYESRLEKTEKLLYEHEKKFLELQNIINNNYQNNDNDNNNKNRTENRTMNETDNENKNKINLSLGKISSLDTIKEDINPNSLSSLEFKYLIKELLIKMEHCEIKEKECVEQVNQLLDRRRDETKELHHIFEEIQQRVNLFGIKKYDDIINSLEQYKKYIDLPISELIEIEKLDLSKKHIYSLPNGFSLLNNIKYLDLMDNYLKQFPIEITKMENLVEINLSYNDIINIPSEIKNLKNLKKLSISNNSIVSIPKEISYLVNLYSLNFSNNRIRKIPSELFNLKKLKWIFLNNNLIEELPKEIVDDLPELKICYIGNNKLKSIPKEIQNSKKILGLYDNNKNTYSIPNEFFNFKRIL
ncbi:outer arm dynein light chain 1 [Anaeromyces robustus]|uniref:Outer arm dynein light chain 1 n=1 Tax=Anaeromyces robustus TaxID=1754192 RepID=A0A1Y1XPM7_9FUNG|nr:outer arm dynein light chain 1 [Anaeromyces robustus]|eukprot:ORX87700.1 outer arm dynein light chain 1 [Anaeromyces robustus]